MEEEAMVGEAGGAGLNAWVEGGKKLIEVAKVMDKLAEGAAQAELMKTRFELRGGMQGSELFSNVSAMTEQNVLGKSLFESAETMQQFGISSKEIVQDLQMLSDVSLGSSDNLKELTKAFGHTKAEGKLMGTELEEYISAGFNPLKVMSEHWQQFGFKQKQTVEELTVLMHKGGVSADMVAKSFQIATAQGGEFYNAINKISNTDGGQLEIFKTKWQKFCDDIGSAILPVEDKLLDLGDKLLHVTGISKTIPEQLQNDKEDLQAYIDLVTDPTISKDERMHMLEEAKDKFPQAFANKDINTMSNNEVLDIRGRATSVYDQKIDLAENDEQYKEITKEINEVEKIRRELKKRNISGALYFANNQNDPYAAYVRGDDNGKSFVDQKYKELETIRQNKKTIALTGEIIQAGTIVANKEEQQKLWGPNTEKNRKIMTDEVSKWNALLMKTGDPFKAAGQFDFSKLIKLFNIKGVDAVPAHHKKEQDQQPTRSNKQQGKNVVINMNKELISALHINTKNANESAAYIKTQVQQALMEIINMQGGAYG